MDWNYVEIAGEIWRRERDSSFVSNRFNCYQICNFPLTYVSPTCFFNSITFPPLLFNAFLVFSSPACSYRRVVLLSACLMMPWTLFRGSPASIICVAKECRVAPYRSTVAPVLPHTLLSTLYL